MKTMKVNLLIIFALCATGVIPATSVSRWFSSTWHDVRVTLRRYANCLGDLPPLKKDGVNESEFLIHQVQVFLDQGKYDNEQLMNVSSLMDEICRLDDTNYPISLNINVSLYNNTVNGKENRCKAIDTAMDSMFHVFKRASWNRSEPLDFSSIYYFNSTAKIFTYNLTDLINTSWIKSETHLEHICKITNSIKSYVEKRIAKMDIDKRDQTTTQRIGALSSVLDFIDTLLDPLLGLQKRLYWDSNNRAEMVYYSLTNQLGNLRDYLGRGLNSTRSAWSNRLRTVTNSTSGNLAPTNVTSSTSTPSATTATSSTTTTTTTTVVPPVNAVISNNQSV